jgi:hypothetical protein
MASVGFVDVEAGRHRWAGRLFGLHSIISSAPVPLRLSQLMDSDNAVASVRAPVHCSGRSAVNVSSRANGAFGPGKTRTG